jgi:hypothetical protein
MLYIKECRYVLKLIELSLLTVALACITTVASKSVNAQKRSTNSSSTKTQVATDKAKEDEPCFSNYKGVRIGMTRDEARQKLGDPKDKGDEQDMFVFSDNEVVQVYYDQSKKVTAISVDYLSGGSGAPECKAIVGTEVESRADGSKYKMVRYPKEGYWVSYNRTAGNSSMVTITIQKIQ